MGTQRMTLRNGKGATVEKVSDMDGFKVIGTKYVLRRDDREGEQDFTTLADADLAYYAAIEEQTHR